MSKYSANYLSTKVRASTLHGVPWWAVGKEDEYAHALYPEGVPFKDVHELIASWEPTTAPLLDSDVVYDLIRQGHAGPDLLAKVEQAALVDSHKLVKSPEGKDVIGSEHVMHLFGEWLTGTVREILGEEVTVLSAGNLDHMMQAWVCVARPEVSTGPGGIRHSPMITFSSSYNGSWKTQQNQNTTLPICDNTATWAREQGIAFRHTSKSNQKLGTYRSVAQALVDGQTDFDVFLEETLAEKVTESEGQRFLDRWLPVDEDKDTDRTKSIRKRVKREITDLYHSDDPRMMDTQGTAFGWLQAKNTWENHRSTIQNKMGFDIDDRNLRAQKMYESRARQDKPGKSADEISLKLLRETLKDSGHKTQFAMA